MTGETQQPQRDSSYKKDDVAPAPVVLQDDSALDRFGRYAATAGSPKLRTTALVGTVSLLLITIVCAPFGALPWWSPILMLLASGGAFAWCRASAMAATAAKGSRDVRRPAPAPRASKPAGSRVGAQLPKRTDAVATAPSVAASAPVVAHPAPAPVAQEPAVAERAAEQVFDVTAAVAPRVSAPAAKAADIVYDATADDSTRSEESTEGWRPVAVPPPTYTMKERAPERPQPAPEPTPAPAPKRTSYEGVANEDLPFDGLALDQDLEELPSVFRVG